MPFGTPRPAPSLSRNSTEPLAPGAHLGMLGGGQLGRMFTEAAQRLGYRVVVLEPKDPCPAGLLADEHLVAGYDQTDALDRLGEMCEAASYEFEAVPAQAVEYLRNRITVRPDAQPLSVAQSRLAEKRFASEYTPATPPVPYQPISDAAQIPAALEQVGVPCILKTDRLGYDGKGQAVIETSADAEAAFSRFGDVPCVLERQLDLQQEISVIVARDCEHSVAYPVAENEHRNGILHCSRAPADVSGIVQKQVQDSARKIADALDYHGVLAVEYFVTSDGVFFNEMAPRPHNSGHYTLDACVASQFEQQARILCGLPLAAPTQHTPAVMINLLGDLWNGGEPDWTPLQDDPTVRLHLYGKEEARPGRKMGHLCVLDSDPDAAYTRACELYRGLGA